MLKDKRKGAPEHMHCDDDNDKLNHIEFFEKFLTVRPPNTDRFYEREEAMKNLALPVYRQANREERQDKNGLANV